MNKLYRLIRLTLVFVILYWALKGCQAEAGWKFLNPQPSAEYKGQVYQKDKELLNLWLLEIKPGTTIKRLEGTTIKRIIRVM